MDDAKVLISILNWNNWKSTIGAINSLRLIQYTNFTIVITDNNSQDDSVIQLKKAFPDLDIWTFDENLGYAGAHKRVAKYAIKHDYDLLWLLNNDVEVFPSTLTELVNAFERNGECLFGSVCLKDDGRTILFGGGFETLDVYDDNLKYNVYEGQIYEQIELLERPVSDLGGASLVIPISLIKKYGFIDTRFFLYGEETDYSYRLRRSYNIQSIIVPNSILIHRASESFRITPELKFVRIYYTTRNSNILYRKYFKNYTMRSSGGFLHLFKFFIRHYLFVNIDKKDYQYWIKYYTKLGYLHAYLNLKGKYLEPNKFIK